jgi:hypothetical protein
MGHPLCVSNQQRGKTDKSHSCSFFRLLLRGFMQLIFLTPKPAAVPGVAPTHRPWVYVILNPNLICMLLHLFTSRPEAGESMRGYLHGGIIIDLIGQKGPTPKTHLLLLDVLVLALQCFMLAVVMEKERLGTVMKAYTSPNSAANRSIVARAEIQDLDAEERGVVRDSVAENGDIELGTMRNREPPSSNERERNNGADSDRAALLAEPPPREHRGDGLDTFWSGRAIVADLHILQVIRRHWRDYGIMNGEATESAWQNVGFRAARSMILLRTEMPAGR